jgi:hypothetical protein
MNNKRSSQGKTPRARLGDTVRHSVFGSGRILAFWPDGAYLVKFENGVGFRLISPHLLDQRLLN